MQMCSNPSIINSMQHLRSPAMNPIPPCTYVKVLYGQAIARPPHHQNQICQPSLLALLQQHRHQAALHRNRRLVKFQATDEKELSHRSIRQRPQAGIDVRHRQVLSLRTPLRDGTAHSLCAQSRSLSRVRSPFCASPPPAIANVWSAASDPPGHRAYPSRFSPHGGDRARRPLSEYRSSAEAARCLCSCSRQGFRTPTP